MDATPYPADTRAKGWRFEVDYERVLQSDTWALATARQRPLLLMLWFVAWQQTPAGSLPDSDELIAARLGMTAHDFAEDKSILMRGWWKASDGRLYHAALTEIVLEMIDRKSREKQRKADYRARVRAGSPAEMSHGTDAGQTRPSHGSDATSTSTGTSLSTESKDSVVAENGDASAPSSSGGKPAPLPDCPQQEVIALYAELLPDLPQPKIWDGARSEALRARWRWRLASNRKEGKPATKDAGMDFFRRLFAYIAKSDFLMGRSGNWQADLGWTVKAENFAKIVQGNYESNGGAA